MIAQPYLILVSNCLQKTEGLNHLVLNPQSLIDNYSDTDI
jgi:hypothetical protein